MEDKLMRLLEITNELVNEDAVVVIEYLYNNPGASEFDISENTGFTVSKIRGLLYELKNKNLIDYDRRKDKEKGWYLYYWFVLEKNFELVYYNEKKKMLSQFKDRLKNEEDKHYYICPNFCKRMSAEEALEHNFTCPVCGSLMNEENSSRKIEMLKKNITEFEKELGEIKQRL